MATGASAAAGNAELRPSGIATSALHALLARERANYIQRNPRSKTQSARAAQHLLFGVPLHWMNDWGTPFACRWPAPRARICRTWMATSWPTSVWATPAPCSATRLRVVTAALQRQAAQGLTTMLPNEDGAVVAELLAARFGMPMWQFAMTATDANRFVLRWMRAATGRKVLLCSTAATTAPWKTCLWTW